MINTYLIQKLTNDQPLGFTRQGGTMRFYMGIVPVSQIDWLNTIDYCLSRGWIVETGAVDSGGSVYDWIYKIDPLTILYNRCIITV